MLLLPKSTESLSSVFSGCRNSYPMPVVVVLGVTKKMSSRKGGGRDAAGQSDSTYLRVSQKAAGCRLCPCQQRFSRPAEFLCHPGSLLHRLHPIQRRMGVCRPLCRRSGFRHHSRQAGRFSTPACRLPCRENRPYPCEIHLPVCTKHSRLPSDRARTQAAWRGGGI